MRRDAPQDVRVDSAPDAPVRAAATPTPAAFREQFQLDPDVTFLNHGSYGATPKPVFASYQAWQRRMERQPVHFYRDELSAHLSNARAALAAFVGAPPTDLVFVPNATFGVNLAAASCQLGEGDEVLTTDHEYGACDNAWQALAAERGFRYVKVALPLPLDEPGAVADRIWNAVSPRTRVLFLSHLTSATAQILPVATLCRRARAAGIRTIIDGAHGPGHVPLDLPALGADVYAGNAHKWLLAPKGSAFLYARPEAQAWLRPLVVGWRRRGRASLGSAFLDDNEMLGTADYSAYLSVPDALRFRRSYDWPAVQAACNARLGSVLERAVALTGAGSAYLHPLPGFQQMAIFPLPGSPDMERLQRELLERYRIELPVTSHGGRIFLRVSVQAYNGDGDMERLLDVVGDLMRSA